MMANFILSILAVCHMMMMIGDKSSKMSLSTLAVRGVHDGD